MECPRPARPAARRRPRGRLALAVALAVAVAVAVWGCAGAAVKAPPEPAAVDSSVAAQGARDLVKEIYGNLRRGSTGGLLALVDPAVIAIGPGPADLFVERSAALVALGTAVPEGKHKLTSTDLRVAASPEGHAAWASDVLLLDGKPYAIGMILVETDELWTVTAVQIGVPVGKKALPHLADAGPLPTPTPAPVPPGGGDKPLAELFVAGAASPAALEDQLADAPPAVVRDVGGKALVGPKAIHKAWKKAMKHVATAPHKELSARLAPDRTMGWVLGIVDTTTGDAPPIPTRVLYVYVATDAGWRLVHAVPAIAR